MDPKTQAALLGALLSGSVEGVVGAAVAPALSALVAKAKEALGGRALGVWEKAASRALTKAQRLVDESADLGSSELRARVVTLLEYREVAEEISRRLLFGEKPDLDRLFLVYRRIAEADGASVADEERIQVELALIPCLDAVVGELERDPEVGGLIGQARQLAALARLESAAVLTAVSTEQIALHTARIAEQSGRAVETGEKSVVLLTEIRDRLPTTGAPGPALTSEERAYLGLLDRECNRLPLVEEKPEGGERRLRRVLLKDVYVDLATTASRAAEEVVERLAVPALERGRLLKHLTGEAAGRKSRGAGRRRREPQRVGLQFGAESFNRLEAEHPLRRWAKDEATWRAAVEVTALEALEHERRLVLLGHPGSGKSTWVNYLSLNLAGVLLDSPATEPPRALAPFPFRIPLRRCHALLGGDDVLEGLYQAIEELTKVPRARCLWRFDRPDSLVFFDGLDEVPTTDAKVALDRRARVLEAVEQFSAAHRECRVVVTCRIKPYQNPNYQMRDLPAFTLAGLDAARIERFVARWYDQLAATGRLEESEAAARRSRLLEVTTRKTELAKMAETPLLLTMLAQVNARTQLPEGRPELYERCVEQLLWKWEQRVAEGGGLPSLAALVQTRGQNLQPDLERTLWRLTFEARSGATRVADAITADELRKALVAIHPSGEPEAWAWAEEVVRLVKERGGLLVEDDDDIFTFPHPSFGEFLAARWLIESGEAPKLARRLALDDRWHETILLACGYLTFRSRFGEVIALLAELSLGDPPQSREEWRRVILAGRGLKEFDPRRAAESALGTELNARLPRLLEQGMLDESLPMRWRWEAGVLAGDLGRMPEGLGTFVLIPADVLDYSFRIGKYPVTNAEFREFIDAGGYDPEQSWWSDEARRDVFSLNVAIGRGAWPAGPCLWCEELYSHPTQPVAGVFWYEARAYCDWLGERLRSSGGLDPREALRLPTEAEWSRAAGGKEGRRYPWGQQPEGGRSNTRETELGLPSPVAMFPLGATPEGVFDLAGNVWAWTADLHKEFPGAPVLVGGGFRNGLNEVGAANRGEGGPRSWDVIGFRVVVVPSSRRTPDF